MIISPPHALAKAMVCSTTDNVRSFKDFRRKKFRKRREETKMQYLYNREVGQPEKGSNQRDRYERNI